MKKKFLVGISFTVVCAILALGAGWLVAAEEEQKPVLLLMEMKCTGEASGVCKAFNDAVYNELVKCDRFNVVDPKARDAAMAENGVDSDDCVKDPKCLVNVAKLVQADKVVYGRLDEKNKVQNITLSLLDAESAKVENTVTQQCVRCNAKRLSKAAAKAVEKLLSE